jgi:hypothetical protein
MRFFRDLSLSVDGDLFQWNGSIVTHEEFIDQMISSFSCCSQLQALRVAFTTEASVLEFKPQNWTDHMKKRFKDAERIREVFPHEDLFMFLPPGKPRKFGSDHIDLSPWISIQDIMNSLEAHRNSFDRRYKQFEVNIGTKRR